MFQMRNLPTALLCGALLCAVQVARADDIDIFVGTSGGASAAPNIIFLLDNSSNWSRAAEQWPDSPTQGQAELKAIATVLPGIARPANVGLSMLTVAGPNGGYIRFAARDISNSTNVTALQNIVNGIDINSPTEKIDIGKKDESAALYELYKYFNGLAPYAGAPAGNPNADFSGNTQTLTGAGQGLRSGFAFKADGTYNSPATSCAKNYIIYIANNANNAGVTGQLSYESAVNVAPDLPPTSLDMRSDEWTKYLFANGIATYVIDAYNANRSPKADNNTGYSAALMAAAKQGGGKYFQASSEAQIQTAINTILDEIQAVSTSFAAANLPSSTTSRTQDLNKVFIGLFQPDPNAQPRWFGNLKAYQLMVSGTDVILGDSETNPIAAVNPQTGFLTQCAVSYWTQDSSAYQPSGVGTAAPYWSLVPVTPTMKGTCPNSGVVPYSDTPDGPFVAKGAAAEVLRMGNNPPATNTKPTWNVNRNLWTQSGSKLATFNASSSGLTQSLVNFISGYDVNDENGNGLTDGSNGNSPETRPSIHGDVIHSQPLAVNYGGSAGIVVYYGANDGMLHAVSGGLGQNGPEPSTSTAGQELWAFIAPEFFPRLNRLMTDSPTINYWGTPAGITPTPTAKDYFFDGSLGLYQDATSSNVWIYPAMRRGGRMLYGLDVSQPSSPAFKWKLGCPDLADDTGCSPSSMAGIGQTWSTPHVAFLKGYSTTVPVVIVGGGYDSCEDANTSAPSCTTPKGAGVYVIDANTGSVLATLPTARSVAGDVSLVDLNFDGYPDYAYVADTGGSLYRIAFVDGPTTLQPLVSSQWSITRIAYTAGAGRKFLFGPAVMPNSNQVYLAIGSGDREHPLAAQYPYTTPVTNRFYVYLDNPSATTASNLDDTTVMADCTIASNCTSVSVNPGSTPQGWFISLATGEQVTSGALIAAGQVAFGTNQPVPASAGTCTTVLGVARGYWVGLLNASGGITGGARSGQFAGGGFPNTPQIATVQVGNTDYTVVSGAAQRNGGASSPIEFQKLTPPTSSKRKRVYWYSPIDN